MAVDVWNAVGTASDGQTLQVMRNTTLGTGTLSWRVVRTVSRGRVRVLYGPMTMTDAAWETLYALLN